MKGGGNEQMKYTCIHDILVYVYIYAKRTNCTERKQPFILFKQKSYFQFITNCLKNLQVSQNVYRLDERFKLESEDLLMLFADK